MIDTPTTIERNKHIREPAVVFGNGKSRRLVDIEKVAGECLVVGCNAFGEEYPELVDYVVALDPRAWLYIKPHERDYSSRAVYVNAGGRNSQTEHVNGSPVVDWWPFARRTGFLSGIAAVLLAKWLGCDPVIISGFDNDGSKAFDKDDPGLPERARRPSEKLYERGAPRPVHKQEQRLEEVLHRAAVEWKVSPIIYQLPRHSFEWAVHKEIPERWRA